MKNIKLKLLPKNPDKKWLKDVTKHYIGLTKDDSVRDIKNIEANYDLINGLMSSDYFNTQLNPLDLPQAKNDTPVKDEIIPIILPSINTLIGEIYDRNIEFKAYVINPDAVSAKEKYIQQQYEKKLKDIISNTEMSEEETKLKLIELKQWLTYDSQDIRERTANHILRDGIERLHFQKITKDGWKDMIYNSQEIYRFSIIKGNVHFERLLPNQVYIYGLPENGNIHESEAIRYARYMSIGEIIKEYGDELTKKDIDKIIEKTSNNSVGDSQVLMFTKELFSLDGSVNEDGQQLITNLDYDKDTNEFLSENDYYKDNKLLVETVYFKLIRKVQKLHTINELTGEEEILDMPENYEVDEQSGEWAETEFINEYWESTRIMYDIYVKQKRCDVQMRDMNNKSIVYAPIVGKVIMNGNKQAKSIVDNLKPIQYQWTIFSKKMALLWARNYGKLVKLDISKIPKKYGFDVDLFMSWITSFGIILEDPFNEAMKGQPAGQFSSSVQPIDMELSSSISQALQYMVYLKQLADEMVGVSRQRRGEVMASDGLGTTQESITRSLKITEEMFQEHHELQKTLLQYILEYTKKTFEKGENKKMQYITDDGIMALYEIDPDIFKDVDYGIFINNTRKQLESEKLFLQLAQAYAQNGALKMSELITLYNSSSMSDKIKKLELAEKQRELMTQQQEKAKMEHEQKMQQQLMEFEQIKHQMEMELQKLKNEGVIAVAQIQAQGKINADEIKKEGDREEALIKKDAEIQKAYILANANAEKQKNNNNKNK